MWSDHSKLLNSMARYVLESETIVFPQQQMSKNLAKISPKFCAAVISRGYFHRDQIGKDYLTDWLETLGGETRKKCYPFTNHFIIDFATNLSNQLADLNSSANNNDDDDDDSG
ncbi:hypothetical protein DERF_009068 [Dermatophagoides farinae]|uniref:Uncharacterized protein n=1 Tax=Dermatophagoides farinae TaxID=6954 RepID=A0A922L268_DERFA|nr:hypothetical protein DERF_009068 [Dermatophagoides farinae]